jgi:hypothetical protein
MIWRLSKLFLFLLGLVCGTYPFLPHAGGVLEKLGEVKGGDSVYRVSKFKQCHKTSQEEIVIRKRVVCTSVFILKIRYQAKADEFAMPRNVMSKQTLAVTENLVARPDCCNFSRSTFDLQLNITPRAPNLQSL